MAKKQLGYILDENGKVVKNYEQKQYLICIVTPEMSDWEIVTGRTAAYEWIKENINDISLEESFILVEGALFEERQSIYSFMKYAGDMIEDGFDINEYINGEWSEDDYRMKNEIDINLMISNTERLNMESMMNGDVSSIPLN